MTRAINDGTFFYDTDPPSKVVGDFLLLDNGWVYMKNQEVLVPPHKAAEISERK